MLMAIMIAGFGGQGVLFAGELLARAGMDSDMYVTWFPSYGPEMRGGTANVTVILSDDEIGSPLVRNPNAALAMNLPSFDKYESLVQENGILVVNSSLINREFLRHDLQGVLLPASDIAEKIAERRLTNMVMLGAFIAKSKILPIEAIHKAMKEKLPEKYRSLLTANMKAIEEGYNYIYN